MTNLKNINSAILDNLLTTIGIKSPNNHFYGQKNSKYQQILAYIEQLKTAFNKLSSKRPIAVLDCCCGKSYLSFLLYAYCTEVWQRPIKIIGIDRQAKLIEQCNNAAHKLNFSNMHFYAGNLEEIDINEQVDIVYSLHACDMATDYTLAKGIATQSRYIFSVSCCQHSNHAKICNHPLTSVSRYGAYKTRLVDMLGDSMRALLLESLGYGTKIFEFAPQYLTPKNIMLHATKGTVKNADQKLATKRYTELVEMFGFETKLAELL